MEKIQNIPSGGILNLFYFAGNPEGTSCISPIAGKEKDML